MESSEHPGLAEVRRVVEELEGDVRDLKNAIKGNPLGGEGLSQIAERNTREIQDVRRIVRGFEEADERREEEAGAREKKRDVFQARAFGLMSVIVGGVLTQIILLYVAGVFGG